MKIIITGGGGFLGSQLARSILERGSLTGPSGAPEPVDEVVLFDVAVPGHALRGIDGKVTVAEGDVADRDLVFSLVDRDDISVFHLASMVSGECELRFDDALRTNLDGGRHVLEACRARGGAPRVVFASSIAAFGGEDMPEVVGDLTKPAPQTTYGATKAIIELLVNDYTRKGFIDGRSARLPTVIIRPGKPNTAASSFASGLFREPLNGEPCELPVERSQPVPVIGYRDVVASFIALHELDGEALGSDRALGLPSIQVRVDEGIAALEAAAAARGIELGPVIDRPDPVIRGIVATWPVATDGSRAAAAGLPPASPLEAIIAAYIEDFLGDEVAGATLQQR